MSIEEAISSAVQKAIEPLVTEITELKSRVNGEYSKYPLALSVPDVAKIMGLSINNARELVELPDFPKRMSGRRIIIPRDGFFRWFNEPANQSKVTAIPSKGVRRA